MHSLVEFIEKTAPPVLVIFSLAASVLARYGTTCFLAGKLFAPLFCKIRGYKSSTLSLMMLLEAVLVTGDPEKACVLKFFC